MKDELTAMAESYLSVDGGTQVGSGIVVWNTRHHSYVLTCAHCVEGSERVDVVWRKGDTVTFHRAKAAVMAFDAVHDLAMLRTRRIAGKRPIAVAMKEPELYERGFVMGSARGLYGTAGEAVISAVGNSAGTKDSKGKYMYTGPAVTGMSGGPLCNEDGELVGIVSEAEAIDGMALGCIGFAVPLKPVRAFMAQALWGDNA
jgi:serine protease Do